MDLLITLLVAVAIAALFIVGLISWSRKQEHIDEMIFLCMKYLVHAQDHEQRCAAARALAKSHDRSALLVLLNILLDEEETASVQQAARLALQEMQHRFRKRRRIIDRLTQQAEQKNYQNIIEILTTRFESRGYKTVPGAYIIGRLYMRLGRYNKAREWLASAASRNKNFNLYGNRIESWIQTCNLKLLQAADNAFAEQDYMQAKEHYAVLDFHLSDTDRHEFAVYLRSACVYCKLQDYVDADQALLQALEHRHQTDLSLSLVPLVQKVLAGENEHSKTRLDKRVTRIMEILLAEAITDE